MELGIFYRLYDVETTNSTQRAGEDIALRIQLPVQSDFFDLSKSNSSLRCKDTNNQSALKTTLGNLLVENCSNKTKAKSKSTFKIEMSGSTRILLVKRDFQLEYDQLLSESGRSMTSAKKFALFHQVYSLFLLAWNDVDRLIEINEDMHRKEGGSSYPHRSSSIELYLNILNYLYYRECKLTKFRYKTKLYEIIKWTTLSTNKAHRAANSLLSILRVSLIRFKLDTSTALVNQIVEASDVDSMFSSIASRPECGSDLMLAHVCAHLVRLERIVRDNFRLKQIDDLAEFAPSALGVNHQIRRLFETYTKNHSSSSAQLWLFYYRFESSRLATDSDHGQIELTSKSTSRLLSIYYQSVRNLPYLKVQCQSI